MDTRILGAPSDTLAIILGGGRGSRLFPLTEQRSKPAVPLGGKYRIIDIPISNCINSGVRKIFVLTQFNSASLNRHVNLAYTFDTFTRGFVEVLAAEQTDENTDWFQGTADAVRHNLRHFERYSPEYFMILSGDQLYQMDYRSLLTYHIRKGASVTVGAVRVPRDQTSSFGIMEVDPGGRISHFHEKPKDKDVVDRLAVTGEKAASLGLDPSQESFLASMGIYIFNRVVLEDILRANPGPDFGHHIIPEAMRMLDVYAYFFDGYWEDIGTIRAFYEANLMMTHKYPPFDIYDATSPLFTNARYLPSSKFYDSRVNDALIAEGCILEEAEVTDSVIGLRSILASGTRVTRSVLMGADFYESQSGREHNGSRGVPPLGIGPGCVIEGAIIDKNARIGAGARIVNESGVETADGNGWAIREGIVIVKKGAIIVEGTVI